MGARGTYRAKSITGGHLAHRHKAAALFPRSGGLVAFLFSLVQMAYQVNRCPADTVII